MISLCARAERAGVRLTSTLATARARCAQLHAVVTSPPIERACRDALLDLALSLSPRVREAPPLPGLAAREASVYLDATGITSLFRSEAGLAAALTERARALDLPVTAGIAGSGRVAHLAARHAMQSHGPGAVHLVPAGQEAAFLDPLSVDLLHPSDALHEALTRFGLGRIGALIALPRHSVQTRLGSEAAHLVAELRGDRRDPPLPAPKNERFEESQEPEVAVTELEALLFVVRGVLSRLLDRLVLRGFACSALEVHLRTEGGGRETRELSLAAPTSDLRVLLRRLRSALESAPPRAPVEALAIAARAVPPRRDQLDLFHPPSPPPAEYDALLAELEALCGVGRVGAPGIADDYRPGRYELKTPHFPESTKAPSSRSADASKPERPLGLALCHLRPPLAAQVQVRAGQPRFVRTPIDSGEVVHCAGPWRSTGMWWNEGERFAFDHFDIALDSGTLLRLRYDYVERCWQVDGVYD